MSETSSHTEGHQGGAEGHGAAGNGAAGHGAGAEPPELRAWLERQFPSQLERLDSDVGRREFMQLMGASLALAGLGSCTRQPDERILPYSKSPEERVPGRPQHYATAMTLGSAALGLIVESHEGRPTKVEGNPEHPASLGATDVFAQAATLGLYDPDRSQVVLQAGSIDTWSGFLTSLRDTLGQGGDGEGVRILTEAVVSPTLAAQLRAYLEAHPKARWHQYEPLHADAELAAARRCYGRPVAVQHRIERAQVIVSFDADFLATGRNGVRHAREFSEGRRVRDERRAMNRLYVVESSPTVTGANADHRLGVTPSEVEGFARQLARELGMQVEAREPDPERQRFVRALARDLRENAGAGLCLAGDLQTPAVHAIARWIDHELGNVNRTVILTEPVEAAPVDHVESLRELVQDALAGEVNALFILGGNPVYDAPAGLDFVGALARVGYRVHLSLYEDETSRLCHWHLPQAHFLESWGDTRAQDGAVSVVQPLIAPLYDGRSAHQVVAALAGDSLASPYDLLRAHWRAESGLEGEAFEAFWRAALHDGVMPDTALRPLELALQPLELGPAPAPAEGVELCFRPDPSVWDGRFANNAWLQELPRPLTRLCWDNAVLMSAELAARLGVETDSVVELELGGRRVSGPVWITPGQPDGAVTVNLGYGRSRAGGVGTGVGFDVYPLRRGEAMGFARALALRPTGETSPLVSVQDHRRMEGRDLVRVKTVSRFDELAHHEEHDVAELSLIPVRDYEPHSWGMVIDLNACIGCNACTIACQAENNVPVVGKQEVAVGREMHWIRVDIYNEQVDGEELVLHQPVPCMHCETAPCELVCPVGATVHSSEGLNQMVYNRCVGTRYCSNNCPYKVRRFNFFNYAHETEEVVALGRNPDVTVRSRGVMEKCTYCVQRINQVKIQAKLEDRAPRDGEVLTACQQVCPTRAIVFGDMDDPDSAITALRREPHHYALLAELGTRPHTTYLARLRNPNPELAETA